MAEKAKFDQEAAFKAIIGVGASKNVEKPAANGRSKSKQETKKRVSLAVYPSSYSDLQKIAYVDRKSVSDIVSEMIANYVVANAEKLKEYEKIIKE